MATEEERAHELRALTPGRLRALVLRRLRNAGGQVADAAHLLGVTEEDFRSLLQSVGAVVELPPSEEFARWFRRAS